MIVNLTPHTVVLSLNDTTVTFPPSGSVARCREITHREGTHDYVPLVRVKYGPVEGLPAPVGGTLYIVSELVRMAMPHRLDLASPGEQVRDSEGKVTGCKSLVIN
jgi:hypothetical protein